MTNEMIALKELQIAALENAATKLWLICLDLQLSGCDKAEAILNNAHTDLIAAKVHLGLSFSNDGSFTGNVHPTIHNAIKSFMP